ncbi:MAG: hypothetical protein JNM90_02600 [Burkholderiales bacterium]|nr:hypothetical protein [Burkholderiales bacterium]
MPNDRYDLPLTTSPAAADAYVAAVDRLLAAGDALVAGFDAALALDSGFALAEIGRARCLATYGRGAEARESAARARTLAAGASARERSHVEAQALAVEGRSADALAAIKTHLASWPRDAMVLQPTAGVFGLVAFSGRAEREEELFALLAPLATHYGDDWWFNTTLAFAECESGRLAAAEDRVMRALEAAPHNGNAAHVRAHVHHELNQAGEGARFLRAWLPGYSPRAMLRGHLNWHLALWEMAAGDAAAGWRLFADEFGAFLDGRGETMPPLNALTDAASWLWRAARAGQAVAPAAWQALAAFARARYPQPGVAFADVHTAMACVGAGDRAGLEHVVADLGRLGGERPACAVAAEIAIGFGALAARDWTAAIRCLEDARGDAVRLGGSRAQREFVERGLVEAYRGAGRAADAAALVTARATLAAGI